MAGIGAPELLIVLVVILVFFGGAKLPKLARSLGSASKEFKAGQVEGDKSIEEAKIESQIEAKREEKPVE